MEFACTRLHTVPRDVRDKVREFVHDDIEQGRIGDLAVVVEVHVVQADQPVKNEPLPQPLGRVVDGGCVPASPVGRRCPGAGHEPVAGLPVPFLAGFPGNSFNHRI